MLKTLLPATIAFIFMAMAASAQTSIDSLLSFYPYQTGNVWIYSYHSIPDLGLRFDITEEVIGDTTTPKGAKFIMTRRVWPFGSLISYLRIDPITGSIYTPGPDSLETEYLYDSIACSSAEPCACGRYQMEELFGEDVLMRLHTCESIATKMARGIGPVERVQTNTNDSKEIITLRYARINGREYGVLQSVDAAAAEHAGLRLAQNSPNPFAATTTIGYSIPAPAHVNISVTTLLGEPVGTLVDAMRPAGEWSVAFDASELPNGTYIYTLQSGRQVVTQRMVVAR